MMLTEEQRNQLEGMAYSWTQLASAGELELRDYHRRRAEAITGALALLSASPPPPKGAGREDGLSQGLGGHPCGERDGAETERAAALAGGDA